MYPDLNLVMNSIRILNYNEISLSFDWYIWDDLYCIVSSNKYFCDLKMTQSRGRNMSSV